MVEVAGETGLLHKLPPNPDPRLWETSGLRGPGGPLVSGRPVAGEC